MQTQNKMEVARCRLKLNKFGSDIPKVPVTPAEIQVLRAAHQVNAGGDPISDIVIIGTVNRSQEAEKQRLQGEYGNLRVRQNNSDVNVIEALFPGLGSALPTTFAQIGAKDLPKQPYKPKNYDPEPTVPEGSEVIAGVEEGDDEVVPVEETPAPAPKPTAAAKK